MGAAVIAGGEFFQRKKTAVEIGEVVEPGRKRGLGDALVGVDEQFAGVADAEFVDVFNECFAKSALEKPGERARAQARHGGDITQREPVGEMFADVGADAVNAGLIAALERGDEAGGGKCARIALVGKGFKDA